MVANQSSLRPGVQFHYELTVGFILGYSRYFTVSLSSCSLAVLEEWMQEGITQQLTTPRHPTLISYRSPPPNTDPLYPLNYDILSPFYVPLWFFAGSSAFKWAKKVCVSRSRSRLTGAHHLNAISCASASDSRSNWGSIGPAKKCMRANCRVSRRTVK
jgi:hypothetical protein